MKNAEDAIQVSSFNTGMDFFYTPQNNIIYLILVAQGPNPSVNVSVSLAYLTDAAYQKGSVAVKNSTQQLNETKIIINNVNVTVDRVR